jgi:hypothetical protein
MKMSVRTSARGRGKKRIRPVKTVSARMRVPTGMDPRPRRRGADASARTWASAWTHLPPLPSPSLPPSLPKKVPGGERPAAQKKRSGRLSSMQEALSLCEKTVLKCTDWAPNVAKQVWDLIQIGVEGNDTFHEYGVTRDIIMNVFG